MGSRKTVGFGPAPPTFPGTYRTQADLTRGFYVIDDGNYSYLGMRGFMIRARTLRSTSPAGYPLMRAYWAQ